MTDGQSEYGRNKEKDKALAVLLNQWDPIRIRIINSGYDLSRIVITQEKTPDGSGLRKQYDVDQMVEMRKSGMSYNAIACETGISATTVIRRIKEAESDDRKAD